MKWSNTAQIISGDTLDARFYILHCENILRKLAGPKSQYSKKTLAIHRMFLFIQVLEATSFSQSREQYTKALESHSSHVDELALVERMPEGYDQSYSSQTLTRASIQDLGLDGPENEFYEEVYGVPGSLLRLIARTTSLINEIESCRCNGGISGPLPHGLAQKALILENSICAWGTRGSHGGRPALNYSDLSAEESETDQASDLPLVMQNCISAAVYHALLIYFFRSVRNTNPVILQHYVESVLRNLETHTQYKTRFSPTRLNVIVWPSFIAACEAIGEGLRARSIECLRQAAWSGFRNWETAENVTREVWRRRDAGYANATWQSVAKESSISMVLT